MKQTQKFLILFLQFPLKSKTTEGNCNYVENTDIHVKKLKHEHSEFINSCLRFVIENKLYCFHLCM